MALADLNGDGELDLAVANVNDGTVSVLMGNGDGTFQNAVTYSAGPGADAVTAADFNGDGKLDLAVANLYANSVTILTNDGTGTSPSRTTSVDANPFYIVGDFDNDGKVDLATANYATNTVSVLHNNGGGSFTRTDIVTGSTVDSLAVGIFNTQVGLVAGNYGTNDFTLLFGKTDGTFFNAGNFPGGNGPNGIALDDFNGDGKLDVVVGDQNGTTANATVLLNTMLQATEGTAFTAWLHRSRTPLLATTGTTPLRSISDGNTSTVTCPFAANGSGGSMSRAATPTPTQRSRCTW